MTVPKLTDRLETELTDFAEGGINLTPAEILFLSDACNRMDSPFADVDARLLETPVHVGGSYLWPLTVGASVWLDTYAIKWWKDSEELYFWALVYALLNARKPEEFVQNEESAFAGVKKIGIKFACHRKELEAAVDKALGVDKNPTEKKSEKATVAWSTVVSELEAHSGIMRHEWLWGRSVLATADSYAALFAIASALAGNDKSRMHDALDDAINNLAQTKKAIRKNHE
jgi:hypothetical protein